jgi:myosin heavy subunit
MIDEELNIPKGSDAGFLSKVFREHGSHPNLKAPSHKDKDCKVCFCIAHFAGVVKYTSTSFLEKNRDSLHADIAGALQTTSHSGFTKELMGSVQTLGGAGAGGGGGGAGGGRKTSVKRRASTLLAFTLGFQFKQQLSLLMQTLNSTAPHFVRCMKPNANKSGEEFDGTLMLSQLRYAGLLEVCRIRQIGYPVRKEFSSFMERYRCIAESDKGKQSTSRKAVFKLTGSDANAAAEVPVLLKALTEMGVLEEGNFAKGDTKVFMRNKQSADLEHARLDALASVATRLQIFLRGRMHQRRYARWLRLLAGLASAAKKRDKEALEHQLDLCTDLPYGGGHLSQVKAAQELCRRLEEEAAVNLLLQEAIDSRSLTELSSALEEAKAFKPPLKSAEVDAATALHAVLLEEKQLKEKIRAAVTRRDLKELRAVLAKAEELQKKGGAGGAGSVMESEEVKQGQALLQRLEEELSAQTELRRLLKVLSGGAGGAGVAGAGELSKHLAALSEALASYTMLGLEETAEFKEAQQVEVSFRLVARLCEALASATVNATNEWTSSGRHDIDPLAAALKKCEAYAKEAQAGGGVGTAMEEEMVKARVVMKALRKEQAAEQMLYAAVTKALHQRTKSQEGGDGTSDAGTLKDLGGHLDYFESVRKGVSKVMSTHSLINNGEGGEGSVVKSEAYRQALELREQMVAEETCRTDLRKAAAGGSDSTLALALGQAAALGLTSSDAAVIVARAASSKLGATGEAREALKAQAKMAATSSTQDLSRIKAAIDDGEQAGLAASAEMAEVRAMYARLQAELDQIESLRRLLVAEAMAADLGEEVHGVDVQVRFSELGQLVATCIRTGQSQTHPAELRQAKLLMARLEQEANLNSQLKAVIHETGSESSTGVAEIERVEEVLARAAAMSLLNERVVDAKQHLAQLKYQQQLSTRLEEARLTNNIEGMKNALMEAQSLGRYVR